MPGSKNKAVDERKLYRQAYYLSIFTILYNLAEGIVSIIFGYRDETLTLFGFGMDSFIEVISGAGILMMILRISKNPETSKGPHEKRALKITGLSFYILAAGLTAGIIINILSKHKPETTLSGHNYLSNFHSCDGLADDGKK